MAVLAVTIVAGCGGGGGQKTVADATSSPTKVIRSGLVDGSVELSFVPRGPGQGARGRLSFSGPFQTDGNTLPNFDLAVSMQETGTEKVDFGMVATANAGYIEFQGQAYELDPAVFSSLSSAAPFTFDPAQWLANPSREGHEEIGGTETVHTSGQPNVERIVPDLEHAAEAIGLKPGNVKVSQGLFDHASLDLFTGVEDGILRRLDVRLGWHGHSEDTPPVKARAESSLTLSHLNEDQQIETPEDAVPFSELPPKLPGQLSGLGEFLGGGPGRTRPGASG